MGLVKKIAIVMCVFFLSPIVRAQVFDGVTLETVALEEALQKIEPGTVVVIGENHNQRVHRDQQLQIMRMLKSNGHNVHTGLEFVYYPDQEKLDQFRGGLLTESEFLKVINWGGDGFEFYRDQILFPNSRDGESAWALNLPRTITGKIARQGLDALTDSEKSLLPPNFSSGRLAYKERFMKTMPHLDPSKAENYFISQSAWDDTMAWNASEIMHRYSNSVLVIVSGDFHVAFGGGLPDRLKARGIRKVFTISQFNSEGLSAKQIESEIAVNNGDIRADLVWVEDLSKSKK